MKYLVTLASLVVFSSSANACPFKDKHHAANSEDTQVLASTVQSESDTELTAAELLLLMKPKTQQQQSYN